ncbi:uncharacterized protein LOC134609424 [Pelobates fuscus]|uniref:uncharacterized protein LOC134609424 n=1 Tax=Pelobates fuscus TaxID=191477 RepID=UPI002FE46FAB
MQRLGFDPVVIADMLKQAGNDLYKKGHYPQALVKYDEAITIISQIVFTGDFRKELAVLFCNRANCLFKLYRWEESLFSALHSFQQDQHHVKAFYRAGCCFVKLNNLSNALEMFKNGLQNMSEMCKKEDVAEFLTEILTVLEVYELLELAFNKRKLRGK